MFLQILTQNSGVSQNDSHGENIAHISSER